VRCTYSLDIVNQVQRTFQVHRTRLFYSPMECGSFRIQTTLDLV
jgi:hypothetical protein